MRWICASIVALAAFALVGCSVIVPAETCSVDTDCAWDERCVREGFCVALVGADLPCGTILGSQHPDALKLGFIITLSGADAQGGIDQKKVLEFAVAEINQNGGIHGLQGQRELAFITCDGEADDDTAVAITQYLHELGVPAVLGPGLSSMLEVAAKEAAIPNGTFMLSPSSTAPSIRDLPDEDLVWRVSSSDTGQTGTLAYFALWLAFEVAYADADNPLEEVTILAVYTLDNYGSEFRQGFEQSLTTSAGVLVPPEAFDLDFQSEGYVSDPDAETWEEDVVSLVGKIKDWSPDIILFVGHDATADILFKLKDVPELADVPLLLTDGTSSQKLATTYRTAAEKPEHIFGVQPGFRTGSAYEHFRTQYDDSEDPVPPIWTEFTYDAVYLLAYAAASMAPDAMSGAGFAEAFTRFSSPDGRLVKVGPNQLITACNDMGDDKNLDVLGASGPLDFDSDTGEPKSVGILRWTLDVPEEDDPTKTGTIKECGPAEIYQDGAKTTYWCNARCMTPDASNPPCPEDVCDADGDICSAGVCTGGDDCKPELAP